MPFDSYPTAGHIEAVLKSAAIWPENDVLQTYARFQADIAAKAAADQCENLLGWDRALVERGEGGELIAATRYFDGGDHNGDLNLNAGLLRFDSVSIGGTLQTRDYTPNFKRLSNRSDSPIIAFRGAFYGNRAGIWGSGYGAGYGGNRIAITGVWGRFLKVPADLFEVCQHKAMANMMDYVYNQQSIGSISQDGFSESFDITGVRTQQNIAETGAKNFNSVCATWARVVF
ncbi:hypothetical protein IAD21_00892 [Abditibacteriota bacterium]|nr:hypothetical protein IAD21_00892 [Abditibacteriota bacterium]